MKKDNIIYGWRIIEKRRLAKKRNSIFICECVRCGHKDKLWASSFGRKKCSKCCPKIIITKLVDKSTLLALYKFWRSNEDKRYLWDNSFEKLVQDVSQYPKPDGFKSFTVTNGVWRWAKTGKLIDGFTQKEWAEKFGISKQRMHQLLKKYKTIQKIKESRNVKVKKERTV